jgi:hypothetical protein
MSNTAVAVASLQVEVFPQGTTFGNVVFTVLDANNNVVSTSAVVTGEVDAASQATFVISTPGQYTISAVRQDASGNVLGNVVVSAPFTVAAPVTVNVSTPANVNVTLS